MTQPYRIRSEETWAQAREAYRAGESAESVCARFDLGIRAFHDRKAKEGWRLRDQPDPEPIDLEDDLDIEVDDAELRRMARSRMASAARRGLVGEALRWARFDDVIARRAEAEDRKDRDRTRLEEREQTQADLDQNRRANDMLRKATASANTLVLEARTLMATDRALTAQQKLHDLHNVQSNSEGTAPVDVDPTPLNRADRRRQLKQGKRRR